MSARGSWQRWYDVIQPYIGRGNFIDYKTKIHLTVTGNADGVVCRARTRYEQYLNYVSWYLFETMRQDPKVPINYMCKDCIAKVKNVDPSNPTEEIQMLILAGTKL